MRATALDSFDHLENHDHSHPILHPAQTGYLHAGRFVPRFFHGCLPAVMGAFHTTYRGHRPGALNRIGQCDLEGMTMAGAGV